MPMTSLLTDLGLNSEHRSAKVIQAFEEVALATIRESAGLNDILQLVGQRLCELLEVSRCSVYLRGEDGLFYGRAGWCRQRDIGEQIRKLIAGTPGDRFTQEIVTSGKPVLIENAGRDSRTIQRTMRRWKVRDMLGVPLVLENVVIGIIYVDNEEDSHSYTDEDFAIAQAFAGLTAVAVQQTKMHTELEQRATVIEGQRSALQQVAEVHSRLTRAILDGVDLQGLLDEVCSLVRKPVLLYSSDMRLIAWKAPANLDLERPPQLSPRALETPWVRRTLASSLAGKRAATTLMPAAPELGSPTRRLLCPLTIAGKLAGFLEVLELGRSLRVFDARVLERAGLSVALQLLTERRQVEAEGQARQDFLDDLLHGYRAAEQLRRRAPLFGLDLSAPKVVVRLNYASPPSLDSGNSRRNQVEALLRDSVEEADAILGTHVPGADLFLLVLAGDGAWRRVASALQAQLDGFLDLGVSYILVSRDHEDLQELPQASVELRELSELLRSVGAPPQLLTSVKAGLVRLVEPARGWDDANRFARRLLAPVLAADGEDGQLLNTLQAYLEAGGQIRTSSRALEVHENTVRYRLARIAELTGLDLGELDTLLDLRFACTWREIFGDDPRLEVTSEC